MGVFLSVGAVNRCCGQLALVKDFSKIGRTYNLEILQGSMANSINYDTFCILAFGGIPPFDA